MPAQSYYDWNSNYGAPQSYYTAPIVSGPGDSYLNNQPQAAFTRFAAPIAPGTDPYSQWVRSQFGQIYQGYQGALATNPNLLFQPGYGNNSFLGGSITPEMLRQRYMGQAPQMRGEMNQNYGAGRVKWGLS